MIILPVFIITALFFFYYRSLFYPERHSDQPSPEIYIEKQVKKLPSTVNKPEVIEHGSRTRHAVALTFDADMTQGMASLLKRHIVKSLYDKKVKDTLDREQVKATVFLSGLWAEVYPKEAWALAHDPLIEIGNHSYDHPGFTKNCFNLPFSDNDKNNDEVLSAQRAIVKATEITPKYFRFPGGCYDSIDIETIARLGLKIVHWDVVGQDAFNSNTNAIVNYVNSHVQNGSIIVFHIHDGQYAPKTNEALLKIIPYLKKQGYEFLTVSEMLQQK